MSDEKRSAEQILQDAAAGKLEPNKITIRETARLTIRDMETGEVTEKVLSETTLTGDQCLTIS